MKKVLFGIFVFLVVSTSGCSFILDQMGRSDGGVSGFTTCGGSSCYSSYSAHGPTYPESWNKPWDDLKEKRKIIREEGEDCDERCQTHRFSIKNRCHKLYEDHFPSIKYKKLRKACIHWVHGIEQFDNEYDTNQYLYDIKECKQKWVDSKCYIYKEIIEEGW
jgi:hypothetical protein